MILWPAVFVNRCSSSPRRQMADGRMLPPLHQWHRPQKDPGAFIRILPTKYIHLCASPPKINLDWCCYSQYLTKEFPVPQFERYCEILNRLKREKKKFLLLTTFGIQTKIFTMKIQTVDGHLYRFHVVFRGLRFHSLCFHVMRMKYYAE